MDWCLIASGWTDPLNWLAGIEVAVGVGLVIFVHELGHFLVAKACGVKCEKFMIGFDIGGIRLLSYRRGETLYGLGILPLGGYVKMLGQEDNPAALRREMERARQEAAEGKPAPRDSVQPPGNPLASRGTTSAEAGQESAEARLLNPRSYLAKSVPQRMAIISAGVIMNLIFAFIFATIAYSVGVKEHPSVIGGVVSGGGAWQAGIRADDAVLEVAGRKVNTFTQMMQETINGDTEHGIPLLIRRRGAQGPLEITVKPQRLGGKPTLGVLSSPTLQLVKEKDLLVFQPGSAAEAAVPPFAHGDRIVKINGQPLETPGQCLDYLVTHADQPLDVTVARSKTSDAGDGKTAGSDEATIKVLVNPMNQFGVTMTMGPMAAVQADSPAAKAGIQPGDLLKTVNGAPAGDPMRLPDLFRELASSEVRLGIERDGKPMELKVKLSTAPPSSESATPDSPVALSELGAAYFVLHTVASVEPDGPAAKAELRPGDRLTKVKFLPLPTDELKALRKKYGNDDISTGELSLPFGETERNWPCFMLAVQSALPGTKVEFTWQRDGKEMSGTAAPAAAKNWFNPERGWNLEPMTEMQTAHSLNEALRMGSRETVDCTFFVSRLLHSVGTGKVSPRNFSSVLGILYVAFAAARAGLGSFLVFLTLISANLAVINFLPIPVLDGGHMVFLLYEGVTGKPADERVQEVLTWIGLILLLSLMVWAFGLDLRFFSRPGAH